MLYPDMVLNNLLLHYNQVIPQKAINSDWIEYVNIEIMNIEKIEIDEDAVHSLLRLLLIMTDAHQYLMGKTGWLCEDCFNEATKRLFSKKLKLWEKAKKVIRSRDLAAIDFSYSNETLCFCRASHFQSMLIYITGSGKQFLYKVPYMGDAVDPVIFENGPRSPVELSPLAEQKTVAMPPELSSTEQKEKIRESPQESESGPLGVVYYCAGQDWHNIDNFKAVFSASGKEPREIIFPDTAFGKAAKHLLLYAATQNGTYSLDDVKAVCKEAGVKVNKYGKDNRYHVRKAMRKALQDATGLENVEIDKKRKNVYCLNMKFQELATGNDLEEMIVPKKEKDVFEHGLNFQKPDSNIPE